MSIHASARWRNAKATAFVWASGLTITGSPAMRFDGQPHHDGTAFIRWSLAPVSETVVGFSSTRTQKVSALLIASVFWPAMSDDGTVGAYDLDTVVDELRDALTIISVPLVDHTLVTPAALPGAHTMRSVTPPTHQRPSTVDGYDRAVVTAPIFWDAYRNS